MAKTIRIAGVTYPDVPSIEVPMSSGGNAIFVDAQGYDLYASKEEPVDAENGDLWIDYSDDVEASYEFIKGVRPSANGAHIETGFIPGVDAGIFLDFGNMSLFDGNDNILFDTASYSDKFYAYWVYSDSGSGYWRLRVNTLGEYVQVCNFLSYSVPERFKLTIDGKSIVLTSGPNEPPISAAYSGSRTAETHEIRLFNVESSARGGCLYDLYEFKAWDENGTQLHLIPAIRSTDGVVGMLDVLSNTFYPPVGGTFTAII